MGHFIKRHLYTPFFFFNLDGNLYISILHNVLAISDNTEVINANET
jgi:hypothetical protein